MLLLLRFTLQPLSIYCCAIVADSSFRLALLCKIWNFCQQLEMPGCVIRARFSPRVRARFCRCCSAVPGAKVVASHWNVSTILSKWWVFFSSLHCSALLKIKICLVEKPRTSGKPIKIWFLRIIFCYYFMLVKSHRRLQTFFPKSNSWSATGHSTLQGELICYLHPCQVELFRNLLVKHGQEIKQPSIMQVEPRWGRAWGVMGKLDLLSSGWLRLCWIHLGEHNVTDLEIFSYLSIYKMGGINVPVLLVLLYSCLR